MPMGMVGHDHHKMMTADFKRRFYVVLIFSLPILALSPMIQHFMLMAASTIIVAINASLLKIK